MAGGFWQSLGSKLIDAGAAYVEQVRLVNELKQLSPEQAQQRFAHYVNDLSSAARAGFAVTLAALANNEPSATVKQFIESLRAELAKPQQSSAPAAPPPAPPPAPARHRPPAVESRPSFDDDLQRVNAWYELTREQRDKTIVPYLESLDDSGLEGLRANLETMQANCATNTRNHRDNEARFAAGRFIEDQNVYRLSVIAGGPRDPDWLRHLEVMEAMGGWFGTVHGAVGVVLDQRRQPPDPPPAPDDDDLLTQLAKEKQLLEEQLADGSFRGERAVMARRVLDKLESLVTGLKRREIDAEQASSAVKQLFTDFAPFFANPGPEARVASGNPRLRDVDGYAGAMKVALGAEAMAARPTATTRAVFAVMGDVTRFQAELGDADEAALAQLESTLLRPAARSRHDLAMTRHALIARPLWESSVYLPEVNRIAYSGGADLRQALDAAVEGRGLTVSDPKRLGNNGQVRWDELNRCHVAFFDLRGAGDITDIATETPKRARELAGAAYELGLAFALGKPIVVAGSAGDAMPFDLDLTPVALEGNDDDAALLGHAIDEAFYVPQRSGGDSSIGKSVAFLDRLTVDHAKRAGFEGMGWLAPGLARDPADFVAKAEQLMLELSASRWRLLRPTWPGAYPDASVRRCFHVMPFGPDWADEVRDVSRAACKERGFDYRRGDEAEEGRIIHAIWDDLCRATIVLVDLTGANLNVMIELGIAHGIGRPVLAVQQRHAMHVRPKHIEKLRVLSYESTSQLAALLQSRLQT